MAYAAAAAAVLALVATAVSVYAQVKAGDAAARMGRLQDEAYRNQAQQARDAADLEARQRETQTQHALAEQRVRGAKGGIDLASGSFLDIATFSATQAQTDVLSARYQGESQARGLLTQGMISRYEGQVKRQGHYLGAVATGFQGASSAISMGAGGGMSGGSGGGTAAGYSSSLGYSYSGAYRGGYSYNPPRRYSGGY